MHDFLKRGNGNGVGAAHERVSLEVGYQIFLMTAPSRLACYGQECIVKPPNIQKSYLCLIMHSQILFSTRNKVWVPESSQHHNFMSNVHFYFVWGKYVNQLIFDLQWLQIDQSSQISLTKGMGSCYGLYSVGFGRWFVWLGGSWALPHRSVSDGDLSPPE